MAAIQHPAWSVQLLQQQQKSEQPSEARIHRYGSVDPRDMEGGSEIVFVSGPMQLYIYVLNTHKQQK